MMRAAGPEAISLPKKKIWVFRMLPSNWGDKGLGGNLERWAAGRDDGLWGIWWGQQQAGLEDIVRLGDLVLLYQADGPGEPKVPGRKAFHALAKIASGIYPANNPKGRGIDVEVMMAFCQTVPFSAIKSDDMLRHSRFCTFCSGTQYLFVDHQFDRLVEVIGRALPDTDEEQLKRHCGLT